MRRVRRGEKFTNALVRAAAGSSVEGGSLGLGETNPLAKKGTRPFATQAQAEVGLGFGVFEARTVEWVELPPSSQIGVRYADGREGLEPAYSTSDLLLRHAIPQRLKDFHVCNEVRDVCTMFLDTPVIFTRPRQNLHIEADNGIGKTTQLVLLTEAMRRARYPFSVIKGGGLQDAMRVHGLSRMSPPWFGAIRRSTMTKVEEIQRNYLRGKFGSDGKRELVFNLYQEMSLAESGLDMQRAGDRFFPDNHIIVGDRSVAISGALAVRERSGNDGLRWLFDQLPKVVLGGVIFLDGDPFVMAQRMKKRGLGESIDLGEMNERRRQYMDIARVLGSRKAMVINGEGSIPQVHEAIVAGINERQWLPEEIRPIDDPEQVLNEEGF